MRLILDAILGALAGVSVTFSLLTQTPWQAGIAYALIAIVLVGLIFLLHLKPNDNAEKMIRPAQVRLLNSIGEIKETIK